MTFDFLGKDSIRYENTVTLESDVYKCLQHFQKGKREGDFMFDEIGAIFLNEYLSVSVNHSIPILVFESKTKK